MSMILGLAACAIASAGFGSMYVVCSAIFISGLITYICTGMPPFQPFAMLGGAIWAIGNLTALPVIKMIGLGLSTLIWGSANCVVGWATGRFGLFGTKATIPSSPLMNYAGLIFVIFGGILFALIPPKIQQNDAENSDENEEQNEQENEEIAGLLTDGAEQQIIMVEQLPYQKRILAIFLSIFAGICYGSLFTPVTYMQDNPDQFHPRPPATSIHYVFSHFSGIYLTSTAVLCLYIAYKQNRPFFDNRLVFPSLLAGIMWAVATLAWYTTTYPIIVSASSATCSLWSVMYFKEVGRKDLKLFLLAMLVTIFGVTLVGLSKAV